ncbi:type I methionyl aminopeptidase [Natroniella sulfidigena]|uniref:type I methionyl aminopeptidase n=1 Tax=Natroniella sulfidigena TaxID=723921 RepID=UPI00200A06DF|nr:type I methionyl aminopeptidase [Natroniella sulfidigena]MCK8816187.1 type I methionyl aminopeptidase [Natroniella sulfidigena]
MIIRKSAREIDTMRKAGQIVAQTHAVLAEKIKPGITTQEIDQIAEEFIRAQGAKPAFKGYQGFPNTVCIAINEQVVHGIPSEYRLEEGDIIGLDIGAVVDGYYGDAAQTLAVGQVSQEAERLLTVTKEALFKGIEQVKVDNRISDISNAVQQHAEQAGYSVVRRFVGHGIGRNMHEEPQVPNFGSPGRGPRLKEGMVLAIEPMINVGGCEVETLDDGWTVVTCDGKLSAHFEHTVAVTESGFRILTQP